LLERATLRDAELDEERDRMEAVNNRVDDTPWIHRTRWPDIFEGLNMKVLTEGCERPKEDAFLEAVWRSVIRVLTIYGLLWRLTRTTLKKSVPIEI
jgi:hypothetical protein